MVAVGVQASILTAAGRLAESYVSLDCPIRTLTGFQCPGCGSTRCLSAIGSGDFAGGAKHNPLLFAVVVAFVSSGLVGIVSPRRFKSLCTSCWRQQQRVALITLSVIVLYTVGRNLVA